MKFEIFLLILGVAALAIFSQMPMANVSGPGQSPGVVGATVVGAPVAEGVGGTTGGTRGEIEGLKILAQFSATNFTVVDGDSIRLKTGPSGQEEIDLRLASIDAPEFNQTSGQAAKRHLQLLTQGRVATFWQTDTDRYRRPVVFMFVSGPGGDTTAPAVDVNARMVADGFAWHAIEFSSSERLQRLQQQAMSDRLGLWGSPNPVPPWEYRDR